MTAGLLSLGFLAVLVFGAAAVDINGVWEMTLQTPQGEQTVDATFVQDKEAIKVSMTGPQGMEMKGEGTLKETDIEWTMTISAQMGDFGSAPWTAKKKK